jgi:RNA polymerase sigma-70 factor (ECF subfamily)
MAILAEQPVPIPAADAFDEDALLADTAAAQAGFPLLYRKYLGRVYRYLYFRTGDRFEAEDLTAQVFLAALEGLPGYRHRGKFAAWLFSIARRKAADHYRRFRVQAPLETVSASLVESLDPLAEAISKEEISRLVMLISSLKAEEQELLHLRFAAELSFNEIAAILQRSPAALKMELYRLLRRLEVSLHEY